jgi:hypothetical protein
VHKRVEAARRYRKAMHKRLEREGYWSRGSTESCGKPRIEKRGQRPPHKIAREGRVLTRYNQRPPVSRSVAAALMSRLRLMGRAGYRYADCNFAVVDNFSGISFSVL